MTIIDRYILRAFVRVLMVSLLSLIGLYVVIDVFTNLEDFLAVRQKPNAVDIYSEYALARTLWLFDLLSPVIALAAAVFAIVNLQRSNEMAAMMAAGISKVRIAMPVIIGTIVVSLFAATSREVLLPNLHDKVSRKIRDWESGEAVQIEPRYDYRAEIYIESGKVHREEQRIESPVFELPSGLLPDNEKLYAKNAVYIEATQDHPSGYLCDHITAPEQFVESKNPQQRSLLVNEKPILFMPVDTNWLKPDQCFVVSGIHFKHLTTGKEWEEHGSTYELIAGLNNPSLDFSPRIRVTIHERFTRPFLDASLVFLGLPIILSRESRNIFVAAGQCLLLVVFFKLAVFTCQGLGNSFYITPALAAWCPAMIFMPLAVFKAHAFWR